MHLIHGEWDDVVNAKESKATVDFLKSFGFAPTSTLIPRLGHSIDDRALKDMGIVLGHMVKGK